VSEEEEKESTYKVNRARITEMRKAKKDEENEEED